MIDISDHCKRVFSLLLLAIFMAFLAPSNTLLAADAEKGGKLFVNNCASCHQVHKKVIGPALANVSEKYEKEWLYKWIRNSTAFIAEGDERANAIYAEYGNSVMTSFPTLSNGDIDDILSYIEVKTAEGPPALSVAAPVAGGGEVVSNGFAWTPSTIFLALITLILLAIILIMSRIVSSLGNVVREKNNLDPIETWSLRSVWNNRIFKLGLCLAVFALLGYTTYDNASSLGYQQGYQPDQPIKFSHKLHAGTHGINCQYCHSGARVGKSAVIPSANICMNCHKQIAEGPQYGKEEIGKIYKAIGWDPEKKEYIADYVQEPIKWNRIHNLPDHVYFNHSQHVVAGKQECQTCHGAIETMEVVAQENSLGMGWCIDCHRTTNVDFAGNDYYSIYHKYHEEMGRDTLAILGKLIEKYTAEVTAKTGDPKLNVERKAAELKLQKVSAARKSIQSNQRKTVTVEDIGGTECQKCHY